MVNTYDRLLSGITDPDGREIPDPATGQVVGRCGAPCRSTAAT
jgi:phenylacetaldehyde dehydrogenase